jgi:hypothetical protein
MFIEPEDFHIADLSGKINGKALGYVFGFLDALLQTRNLDIRDAEGYAAMISILGRLFPNEVGLVSTYVNYLRKNMEHDAETFDGVMLGGQQAKDFLDRGTPPVRWAICFSKKLEQLVKQRDPQRR